MSVIWTSRTRALGNRAPRWPFRLNASSSLARGIEFGWTSAPGVMIDLLRGPLTVNGAPTHDVIGDLGMSTPHLDASDDSWTVGDDALFDRGGGDWCIDGWIRSTSTSGGKCIIGKDEVGQRQIYASVNEGGPGSLWVGYFSGGSFRSAKESANVIPATGANHIVMQRRGSTMELFVDGMTRATGSATGDMDATSSTLYLGQRGYSGFKYFFPGAIPFLNFRTVSLGAGERAALYDPSSRWDMYDSRAITYFIPAAAGASPDLTTGVEFDGSTDYYTRVTDLTGNADGKQGTVAFLLKTGALNSHFIYESSNFHIRILTLTDQLEIQGKNASGTQILQLLSPVLEVDRWYAVLAAWDLATSTATIYVDDADETSSPVVTNDTIDYTDTDHGVGATAAGANFYDGCLGEFWLSREYIDISVEANRRDFFDSLGNPADKGSDGSTPTGTAPIVYLSGGEAQFATNFGTGGTFTENGTPIDCAIPNFSAGFAVPSGLSLLGVGA